MDIKNKQKKLFFLYVIFTLCLLFFSYYSLSVYPSVRYAISLLISLFVFYYKIHIPICDYFNEAFDSELEE